MSTVLEFSSPPEEFPLGSVFETLPGVTVELERMILHETKIFRTFGSEAQKSTTSKPRSAPTPGSQISN